MLSDQLLERALAWLVRERGEELLHAARQAFTAATGSIDANASDYEARTAHFFEQLLCAPEHGAPIAGFARAEPSLTHGDRRQLAGWLRSHRSLYVYERREGARGVVRDGVLGVTLRVALDTRDEQLVAGDCFDCRIVPVSGQLWLSRGRVYHPRAAHEALHALLAQVDLDALRRAALLDGLLLMRSRFLQFESIRAEHVYQTQALAPLRLPVRPSDG